MVYISLTVVNVYKRRDDGRWVAYCVDNMGSPHIISYPRILMEEKLGRPLEPDEDVHHIDGNVDNNDINNLEILKHGEHQRAHSIKYVDTIESCMICGASFVMTAKQWSRLFADLSRSDRKSRILTCSKSCAGKASSGAYTYLYQLNDRLIEVESLWKK